MHHHVLPTLPDYQLKVPRSLQLLVLFGALIGIFSFFLFLEQQPLIASLLLIAALVIGGIGLLLYTIIDPRGRQRAQQQMIAAVAWTGSEQVLDVGCGNGIITHAAAQHLLVGKGKATGIDIWVESSGDQTAPNFWKNAALEGVTERVDLQPVDARRMPYADATFDVIFASLSLHHMGTAADRQQAAGEMLRVLKPGGSILIYDILPIASGAARTLRGLGASKIDRLGGGIMRTLRIQKSA
ncbi:MAG: methyltransferase domain-containing protein [Chloroflexi bacterium]|nr:methyltransferase domain-containing protein [Chloroflexota bacterium]